MVNHTIRWWPEEFERGAKETRLETPQRGSSGVPVDFFLGLVVEITRSMWIHVSTQLHQILRAFDGEYWVHTKCFWLCLSQWPFKLFAWGACAMTVHWKGSCYCEMKLLLMQDEAKPFVGIRRLGDTPYKSSREITSPFGEHFTGAVWPWSSVNRLVTISASELLWTTNWPIIIHHSPSLVV